MRACKGAFRAGGSCLGIVAAGMLLALAAAAPLRAAPPQVSQAQPAGSAAAGQATDPYGADRAQVDYLLDATLRREPPAAFVEGLYDAPDAAGDTIARYLTVGEPSPEERAKRAVALARGIVNNRRAGSEPETRDRLIETLRLAASQTICSVWFVGTEIANGYVPRLSSLPYDFGGPASQVASGFTLITAQSSIFAGGNPVDREGLGTGALLFDGISGLDKILLFAPNGRYILIILTAQGGSGEVFMMRVNGEEHWIAWTPAAEWPLGDPLVPASGLQAATTANGGFAGRLSLPVRLADGVLTIDFEELPASFPIAALQLVLHEEGEEADLDEDDCLAWDKAQQAAIDEILTGGPGDGDDPVIDPPDDDGCVDGGCPNENPDDTSPSGAT